MTLSLLLTLLACSDSFKDDGDTATDPALDPADVDDDGDGYTENDGDCDDANAAVSPEGEETAYNGTDDDCDEATPDDDGDGDGVSVSEDCDDGNARVSPNADEVPYNGVDDDCNARTSDNDADGDGFERNADCDDQDPKANPNGTEEDWNGTDENCDGYDVNLGACVQRGVQAAVASLGNVYPLDDFSDDYTFSGYGLWRTVQDQEAYLSMGTPRVSEGSTATTFAVDLAATMSLNDESYPFYVEARYDIFFDEGFFACYGWTNPVSTDFEGNISLRIAGQNVTASTSVTADRAAFSRDVLNLTPYDGSITCSLDLIDTGADLLSGYIGYTIPSVLSIFDESGAAATNLMTNEIEAVVSASVSDACSAP